jgi:hypothetical protein
MWIVGYCRFHFVGRLMSVAMTAEFVIDAGGGDLALRRPRVCGHDTDPDRPV